MGVEHEENYDARSPVPGLGDRVRTRREALGWNQTTLAFRARITQAKVSQIENGGRRGAIFATTCRDLAAALGVPSDWLLGLTDEVRPYPPPRRTR